MGKFGPHAVAIQDHYWEIYSVNTGVLNLTPVGVNTGPHPHVITLHPGVST